MPTAAHATRNPQRRRAAWLGLALLLAPALVLADEPVPNKGDTAWMLTSTAFVLMMSVPALALFYGGLVRTKNMLSVLMQVFVGFSLITVLWCVYGYSLAFTEGNAFIGGLSRTFLRGTFDPRTGAFSLAATFSRNTPLYELVYVAFQATFAVEYEAALEPGRARGVTKEAAILVDIEHDVLRKESEQRHRRLVLPNSQQANVGLVCAVHFHGIIGDTAAELARQLLDPAVGEGNIGPPDKRVAIGRGARMLRLRKIRIVLGTGSVARRRDGIAW